MAQVARAVYEVSVAWDRSQSGFFTFDSSQLDGPQPFAPAALVVPAFSGIYDNLIRPLDANWPTRVDRMSWFRGRSDTLEDVVAGEATIEVWDPRGLLNPKNAASPLALQVIDPMRPVRIRAKTRLPTAVDDAAYYVTAAGNEQTDATRAAAIQGDGRAIPDSSFGLWEGSTNRLLNGGAEADAANWAAIAPTPAVTERYAQALAAQLGTTVISPATNTTQGALLVLLTGTQSGKTITGVVDSKGNTWTVDQVAGAAGSAASIASCILAAALTTGDTITITWSSATSAICELWLEEVTGAASVAPFDTGANALATGTAVSAGPTAALAQANEVVFAVSRMANSSAWTKGGGFSDLTTPSLVNGVRRSGVEYETVNSTAAVTATGTWGTSGAWAMTVATYKLATPTVARSLVDKKYGAASVKLTTDGAADEGVAATSAAGLAAAPGAGFAGSVWLKAATGGDVGKQARIFTRITNTDASVTDGADLLLTLPAIWTRFRAPLATVAGGKTGDSVALRLATRAGAAVAFSTYVDGAQVEQKPLATPYIETSGAAAARAAARAQIPASLLDETRGWAAFKIRYGFASTAPPAANAYLLDWRDNANNLHGLYFDVAAKTWTAKRLSGGAGAAAGSAVQAFAIDDQAVIVVAWDATSLKVSVNGGAFVSVANASVPVLAAALVDLGSQAGASQLDGDILWSAVGTGPLTDADASALNTLATETAASLTAALPNAVSTWFWAATTTAASHITSPLVTWPCFYGFLRELDYEPRGTRGGRATLHCADLFLFLDEPPVIASRTNTTTGAVIGAVLDAIGWTDPVYRSLAAGDAIASWSEANGTVGGLALIANVLVTELGLFYVAGDGTAEYDDRNVRGRKRTPSYSFADVMRAIGPGASADRVKNRATYQKTGSTAQTYTDAASADPLRGYGLRALSPVVSPYLVDDNAALSRAQYVVNVKKDPVGPLYNFQIDNRTTALLQALLDLEISDLIQASEAGTGTNVTAYIERLEHTVELGSRQRHSATYILSERKKVAFIFDTSSFDSTDVLGL